MEIYNLLMEKNIEVNGDQDISMVKAFLLINLNIHEKVYGNMESIRFDLFNVIYYSLFVIITYFYQSFFVQKYL